MNNTRSLRQETLDLLRFPLAIIVVIAHTFNLNDVVASGITYRVSEYQIFRDSLVFIDAFLRGISVPIYFYISGYVFFVGVKFCSKVYKQKIKNRIKTLFIPYIIWNGIALFLIIFKQLPIFETFLSNSNSILNLTPYTILECFWKYNGNINPNSFVDGEPQIFSGSYFPVNAALWYLRDLMIIVLSTPTIYWLVKRLKVYVVFLFLTLSIVSLILGWPISMLADGYFYFTWGAYMSILNIDMIGVFKKWFKLSVFMYVVNCIFYIILRNSAPEVIVWIKKLNALFALFACFNIAAWLLQKTYLKVNSFLASSSFFIYVSHCVVHERLRKILFIIFKPNNGFETLSIYILTVILTVFLLLSTFYLLKKYCPSFLKVVAGRK